MELRAKGGTFIAICTMKELSEKLDLLKSENVEWSLEVQTHILANHRDEALRQRDFTSVVSVLMPWGDTGAFDAHAPLLRAASGSLQHKIDQYEKLVFSQMVCAIICEGEAKAALHIQLIDAMHQMMEAEDIVELDDTCAKRYKDTVATCLIVSASYHCPIDASYDDDIKTAEELETYKEGAGSSMNVLARTMAALKLDMWWGARLQAYKEALPQIIAHGASFETNKIALEKLCAGALPLMTQLRRCLRLCATSLR